MPGTIKIKNGHGNERIFRGLEDAVTGTERAVRHAWFGLARDMADRASAEILRKPKSGRLYIRRDKAGRRRRHRASAPGETHANRTGELRKSIGWNVHGSIELTFGYGITGNSPVYDEFVEFGTSKMEPRPSLENAINFAQAHFVMRFTDAMSQEFDD